MILHTVSQSTWIPGQQPCELIDAGHGRRLERFGEVVVDRPAPGATEPRRDRTRWAESDLHFKRGRGWTGRRDLEPWTVSVEGLTLELRPTPAGQVGWFPEHATLWAWLRDAASQVEQPQVLNLFAYTGATTLALARGGARVAHVDSSRPAVAWARRNAELSALTDAPIRWLVDDAETFVARELRRGRRYDGLVLDPPTYGHGGRRVWRLEERLPALLASCAGLLADGPAFVLLTAHTLGHDAAILEDALRAAVGVRGGNVESGPLEMRATSSAVLPLGAWARWRSAAR
jgi:23S rRNA (cytosine1962-C5)-methyltransferase